MAFFITDKCIGCTVCATNCPTDTISGQRSQLYIIDPTDCIDCGVCAIYCPVDAAGRFTEGPFAGESIWDANPKIIELLRQRVAGRKHRYMPASLLDSQLATLEPPAQPPGRFRTGGADRLRRRLPDRAPAAGDVFR